MGFSKVGRFSHAIVSGDNIGCILGYSIWDLITRANALQCTLGTLAKANASLMVGRPAQTSVLNKGKSGEVNKIHYEDYVRDMFLKYIEK